MRRVRIAFLAGDRGDVDDAAVILLDHAPHDCLATNEGTVEIDAQHLAPFVEIGLPYRLVDTGDAGIVDQDVDLAECFQRGVAGLLDCAEIGYVDLECRDGGADFLGCPFREWLVVIPDRHPGSGDHEALGNRAPETLRAAGDHGAAAVQIDLVHRCFLYRGTNSSWSFPGRARRIPE